MSVNAINTKAVQNSETKTQVKNETKNENKSIFESADKFADDAFMIKRIGTISFKDVLEAMEKLCEKASIEEPLPVYSYDGDPLIGTKPLHKDTPKAMEKICKGSSEPKSLDDYLLYATENA